jgi:hypothetical protein
MGDVFTSMLKPDQYIKHLSVAVVIYSLDSFNSLTVSCSDSQLSMDQTLLGELIHRYCATDMNVERPYQT